jgi:preprotein translocase SecE subunit
VARARKSSQRRRANAQPARGRPKPAPGRPSGDAAPPPDARGAVAGRSGDASVDDTGLPSGSVEGAGLGTGSVDEAGLGPRSVDDARGEEPVDDELLGEQPDDDESRGRQPDDGESLGEEPEDDALLGGEPDDDELLGDATVDDLLVGDDPVMAALEPADLPVGVVPTDPPTLPPVELTDDEPGETGEYSSARARLAANRLDESDEILPAARRAAGRPAAKASGNRVTAFLRASWAELQRVQWPDRRQVGQATAVVLGFVVVAGGFLGLADLLGSDLVNAIL